VAPSRPTACVALQQLTALLSAQVERRGAEDAERPLELLQHAQEAAAGCGALRPSRRAGCHPLLVTGHARCQRRAEGVAGSSCTRACVEV
jgi:hypothetical protein